MKKRPKKKFKMLQVIKHDQRPHTYVGMSAHHHRLINWSHPPTLKDLTPLHPYTLEFPLQVFEGEEHLIPFIEQYIQNHDRVAWIVTRDIRLHDNLVLYLATINPLVIPVVALDGLQLRSGGFNSVHFFLESLQDLKNILKDRGSDLAVTVYPSSDLDLDQPYCVFKYLETIGVKCVYISKYYTEFERLRCQAYAERFIVHEVDDVLGWTIQTLERKQGPYKKHRAMMEFVKNQPRRPEVTPDLGKLAHFTFPLEPQLLPQILKLPAKSRLATWSGGETHARKMISKRNGLSPHIKFGNVSVRELLSLETLDNMTDGLIWRAQYYAIGYYRRSCVYRYISMTWKNERYPHLISGRSGLVFFDAGINELIETGMLDNAVRMRIAWATVFIFEVDWRLMENFFRQHLVDYDWYLNNCNWCWSVQIGTDFPTTNGIHKVIRYFNLSYESIRKKRDHRIYVERWLPSNNPGRTNSGIKDYINTEHGLKIDLERSVEIDAVYLLQKNNEGFDQTFAHPDYIPYSPGSPGSPGSPND